MAAKDDELLTSFQRYQDQLGGGRRMFEAQVASDLSRAVNPLTRERELAQAATVPVEEEPATAVTIVPSPQPNPFIRPPFPLATMPVEQQLAWQDREDARRKEQAALSAQLLATDVARKEQEIKQKAIDQGRAMIAEMDILDPSKDDYLTQKAVLARRYPAAAGSLEVDRAFGHLDAIHAKLLEIQGKSKTAEEARAAAFEQKRLEAGYKQAEKLGPDVEREYAALIATDSKAANALLAKRQQENLIATMAQGGMSPGEIAKYGTGEGFQYQAAQEALKNRAAASTELARATTLFTALGKARAESGFDPAESIKRGKDPYAEASGWTPALEQAYTSATEALNAATPKLPANRAGVTGMEGAQEGQSLYRDYVRPAPVTSTGPLPAPVMPLVATRPPAAPAAAPQQALALEPVGTQKVVNGVPIVKNKDGKWYKIKSR
jgi:hypothetical protein